MNHPRCLRLGAALVAAPLALALAGPARAQSAPPEDQPPPPLVQAGPTEVHAAPARHGRVTALAGDLGVRPFIGFTGDMGLSPQMANRAISGTKLLLGADLISGKNAGLVWVGGLHLGIGGGGLVLQPVVEVHYRFHLPLPIVPWIGGGISLKLAFAPLLATNLALTFRFDAGIEYLVTRHLAIGMQLVLPDLGPVLVSDFGYVVGSVEWFVGPHFRF